MMTAVLPAWARLGFITMALLMVFGLGVRHGENREGQKHLDYISEQATASIKLMQRQQVVVTKIETKYRDRIKTIYLNGEEIEKSVKDFISPVADARCIVNTGFVRIHDAAWTNTPAGDVASSDGEPSGVSLVEVGEAEAHNAKACFAWREKVFGLRETYEKLKALQDTGIR
ncbi:hypothetical protein [Undibacterium sp. Ji22W]|uniref:hypothetical protein n=1 Tax=Undibacterium sp. Ji22W TaxID=3413038 RepID=UPI003BEF75F5